MTPSPSSPNAAAAARPVSAWLLLAVLCILAAAVAAGAVQLAAWAIWAYRGGIHVTSALALAVAWRLVLMAVCTGIAVGIYRRRAWGRWLGVAAIVGLAAFGLVLPDSTSYANEAQRAGGFWGRAFIVSVLLGWWAYAFGFSSKARRYFAKQPV